MTDPVTNNPSSPNVVDQKERYRRIQKVTLVGAIVNLFLAVLKIVLGMVSQSQALIADGVHSIADLISDAVVLYAAKHSTKEADDEHPYGHGRIETLVSVLLGVFLVVIAAGIMFDALARIAEPERLLHPGMLALLAAFISILANESLFQYTIRAAKKVRSSMLHANAWHHRSDAISSVIALVGIGGTMLGFAFMDAVAAVGVSLMIAKVGWDIAWNALKELLDTSLETEKLDSIKEKILSVDGVKQIHMLRTRSHGGMAFVDVHLLINDPKISVSEGHQISIAVQEKLLREIDEVGDVTVHIDPEDDEECAPCENLPMRDQLMAKLEQSWVKNPLHAKIKRVILHYLDGKVFVELTLPLNLVESPQAGEAIAREFSAYVTVDKRIAEIKVVFC